MGESENNPAAVYERYSLAGFAYVAAGIGLWLQKRWTAGLAIACSGASLAVFTAFGAHVASGSA